MIETIEYFLTHSKDVIKIKVKIMTIEQIEHALKVMYSQVKDLKGKVSDLEKDMEFYSALDLSEETKKKRHYWKDTDNRTNR